MTDISPYETLVETSPTDPAAKKESQAKTQSERMKERWAKAKAEGKGIGFAKPKGAGAGESKESKPAAPRKGANAKRENTAELWGELWDSTAQYAVSPMAPYAARAMAMQVDVVGMILDEETAGTVIDRLAMQPIARRKGAIDAIRACAEMPIRCELLARAHATGDQGAVERMRPGLMRATKRWVMAMAPRLAKMKAEEEKARKILADLDPELVGGAESLDELAGKILESIFSLPPPAATSAEPPAGDDS